jgi:hypothetical protein
MRLRGINNRDGHFKFNFNFLNLKLNLKPEARQPLSESRSAVHRALRQSRSLAGYYGALCCHVTGGHHAVPPPLEAVASCSLVPRLASGSGPPAIPEGALIIVAQPRQ